MENNDNKIIFMDFFAGWCGPCNEQDPIIDELKIKFDKIVEFRKIDVDKEEELSDRYDVRKIPTLIIEKNGKILARYVGVTNFFIIDKKIREIVGKKN